MNDSNDLDPKQAEDQHLTISEAKGSTQISKKQSALTGYLKKAVFTLIVFALIGSALLMFATWLISNTILSALPK